MRNKLKTSILLLALFFSLVSMPIMGNANEQNVQKGQSSLFEQLAIDKENGAIIDNSTIPVDPNQGFTPNYVATQVHAGQMFNSLGNLAGKYGYMVAYDSSSGSLNNQYFFPSIEAKAISMAGMHISNAKITVTGTKPDGTAISGLEFCDLGYLTSPQQQGSEWRDALSTIAAGISPYDPTGISNAIAIGGPSAVAGVNYNANSAWAEFDAPSPTQAAQERGLQFRFSLHCDPDLPGTYTINIHYHITVHLSIYPVIDRDEAEADLYQTITYDFNAPPDAYVSGIQAYSWQGSAAGVDNPSYLTGSSIDGNFAHLHAGDWYSQAAIVGITNTQTSGHIYLYGYSGTGYTSHLMVYVSSNNVNWGNPIVDTYIQSTTPYYIDCGSASNFRYIAIVAYDIGYSVCLNIDAVCIYN